jgi:transcriptional regulator with XRE-family HTH domain
MDTAATPPPPGLAAADLRLARRLRALRLERGWSLETLCERSGVSRATLSRTENGQVSPTAAVLGRLCAAFELTMSRLLAQVEDEHPALLPREAQPLWVDPDTGFRRRSVSPPASGFDCELLSCELPPGAEIAYPAPPRAGLEHHLHLVSGSLELTLDGSAHLLREGDCLRYKLRGASAFRALGDAPVRYFLVIR